MDAKQQGVEEGNRSQPQKSLLKRIKIMIKKMQKNEKKKVRHPFIDIIPLWILILIFIGYLIPLVVIIFLGIFKVFPSTVETKTFSFEDKVGFSSDFSKRLFNGSLVLDGSLQLSGFNQELSCYLSIEAAGRTSEGKASTFSLNDEIHFRTTIIGTNSISDSVKIEDNTMKNKTLNCRLSSSTKRLNKDYNTTKNLGSSDYYMNSEYVDLLECDRMEILWLPHIFYDKYTSSISFNIVQKTDYSSLISNSLIKGCNIQFEYTPLDYSLTEIIFRYSLLAVNVAVLLFFLFYTFTMQLFHKLMLEQKIVLSLLVTLLLYNNPFFILNIIMNGMVFPLLNLIFISTFIVSLLYSILIEFHSSIKPPSQRTFFGFYFTKILVCFLIWLFLCVMFCFIRFRKGMGYDTNNDLQNFPFIDYTTFSMTDVSEASQFMAFVLIALIGSLVFYCVMFFYYVVRAIVAFFKKTLPIYYNRRVQMLFLFVIFVVIGSIVNAILIAAFEFVNAAVYLLFFVGYNELVIVLAVLYMPSWKTRSISSVNREESVFFQDEDFEYGQIPSKDKDNGEASSDSDNFFKEENYVLAQEKKTENKIEEKESKESALENEEIKKPQEEELKEVKITDDIPKNEKFDDTKKDTKKNPFKFEPFKVENILQKKENLEKDSTVVFEVDSQK